MNPLGPSPNDDPAKQAVLLIQKLTVVLGALKHQIETNAQATASLEKLTQDLQQKVDVIRTNAALPTPATATKADLDSLAARIDERLSAAQGRCNAILAVSVVGVIVAAAVAVRIMS